MSATPPGTGQPTSHLPADASAMPRGEFARRVVIAAGIVTLFLAVMAAAVLAYNAILLVFVSVLLAVLLRAGSDAVADTVGGRSGVWLAVILVGLAAAVGAGSYFAGTTAVDQFNDLTKDLPKSVEEVRTWVEQRPWGPEALRRLPDRPEALAGYNFSEKAGGLFRTTFGVLGDLIFVTFLTLYMAASPKTYIDGLVTLVPPRHRARGRQVVLSLGFHLRWWMIGRIVSMVEVGVLTGLALFVLGVPQFLVIGLIAGVLTALPYIGPIVAAIPVLVAAAVHGPTTAAYALAAYTAINMFDNYLVTPLVAERFVNLPPVIAIAAIVVAGALFGVVGMIVASPLAVIVLVLVKLLYVEDVLGDRLDVTGTPPKGAA